MSQLINNKNAFWVEARGSSRTKLMITNNTKIIIWIWYILQDQSKHFPRNSKKEVSVEHMLVYKKVKIQSPFSQSLIPPLVFCSHRPPPIIYLPSFWVLSFEFLSFDWHVLSQAWLLIFCSNLCTDYSGSCSRVTTHTSEHGATVVVNLQI